MHSAPFAGPPACPPSLGRREEPTTALANEQPAADMALLQLTRSNIRSRRSRVRATNKTFLNEGQDG
jgi:hypothetical protein